MAPVANPILKAVGPGTTHASPTLYERMGGEAKLEAVVNGVYLLMRDDKEIGKQFARFRLERLKDRTVDYLRGEFGGAKYQGSDLWISHSHMGITNRWYDIMMGYYVKMLKKERIGKEETKEILESLEQMREPICDPGLKLKEMYLQHCAKEAAKTGGDGWGKVSANKKERDAKELETLTLLTQKRVPDSAPQDKRGKSRERVPAHPEIKLERLKTGKDPGGQEPVVKAQRLKTAQEQPGRKEERRQSMEEQPMCKVETLKTGQEQPESKVDKSKTGQDGADPPLPPPSHGPPRSASRGTSRSRRRQGNSGEFEDKDSVSTPHARRASSQRSSRNKDVDVKSHSSTTHSSTIERQSTADESSFDPTEDGPPEPVPSSMPSGAELLYRLSNAPVKLGGGLFDFCPASDQPPEEVPSSNPSGAEQLYRFALAYSSAVRRKSSSMLLTVAG